MLDRHERVKTSIYPAPAVYRDVSHVNLLVTCFFFMFPKLYEVGRCRASPRRRRRVREVSGVHMAGVAGLGCEAGPGWVWRLRSFCFCPLPQEAQPGAPAPTAESLNETYEKHNRWGLGSGDGSGASPADSIISTTPVSRVFFLGLHDAGSCISAELEATQRGGGEGRI